MKEFILGCAIGLAMILITIIAVTTVIPLVYDNITECNRGDYSDMQTYIKEEPLLRKDICTAFENGWVSKSEFKHIKTSYYQQKILGFRNN